MSGQDPSAEEGRGASLELERTMNEVDEEAGREDDDVFIADDDETALTPNDVAPAGSKQSQSEAAKAEEFAKDETFIYWGMIVCGTSLLLPFNSFILATDFYVQRFPNTSIVFSINLTYLVINFLATVITNLSIESVKHAARITSGLLISLLAVLVIVSLDLLLELFDPKTAYTVTLTMAGLSAIGTSVAQTSMYGYTAMLNKRHTQAVMVGESVAGVVACIARLITKAAVTNLTLNTAIFFCFTLGVLLLATLLFHVGHQRPFVTSRVEACLAAANEVYHNCRDGEKKEILQQGRLQGYGTSTSGTGNKSSSNPSSTKVELDVTAAIRSRWYVVKKIWGYTASIALTYCVTAAIFPGMFSRILSSALGSWMPLLLYSIYNLLDLVGKILSHWTQDWTGLQLLIWSMIRLIFIPIIMLCVTPLSSPILNHEAYPSFLAAMLGITNGFLGSAAIILASHSVAESRREVAGNVMIMALCFGVAVGAAMSFGLNWVIAQTGISHKQLWDTMSYV